MSSLRPSTAGDWPQVLTKVEKALAQAVALIQEREQILAGAAAEVPQAPVLDFQRLEQRQNALEACPKPTEQHLAALDASLREGEEALRQWLARAEKVRRQLEQSAVGSTQ